MVQAPSFPHCIVKQEPADGDSVAGMDSSQLQTSDVNVTVRTADQHHPTETSGNLK